MAGKPSSSHGIWPWLGVALLIFLADQFTKTLILQNYQTPDPNRLPDQTVITGFFNIVRAHNPGAAFSFLGDASGWQRWLFTGIGVAAAVFIVWTLRSHAAQKLFSFALACILGGAVGNVVDRMMHGYVVDFLDFHWRFLSPLFHEGHFPAFNVADSAITIGAVCLILDEVLRVRRGK